MTGDGLETLEGHSESVLSVAWSPDGATLASSSRNNSRKRGSNIILCVGCRETREGPQTPLDYSASVLSVAWSPDKKILATGLADSTIKLWNVWEGENLLNLGRPFGSGR